MELILSVMEVPVDDGHLEDTEDHRAISVHFVLGACTDGVVDGCITRLRSKAIEHGLRGWATQASERTLFGVLVGDEANILGMKEWMKGSAVTVPENWEPRT